MLDTVVSLLLWFSHSVKFSLFGISPMNSFIFLFPHCWCINMDFYDVLSCSLFSINLTNTGLEWRLVVGGWVNKFLIIKPGEKTKNPNLSLPPILPEILMQKKHRFYEDVENNFCSAGCTFIHFCTTCCTFSNILDANLVKKSSLIFCASSCTTPMTFTQFMGWFNLCRKEFNTWSCLYCYM